MNVLKKANERGLSYSQKRIIIGEPDTGLNRIKQPVFNFRSNALFLPARLTPSYGLI
jgi:hypothetical protein